MLTDTAATKPNKARTVMLLGPAFVAAIAYVDPGNVAANITAGAKYGYLLVWVLVLANLMAVMIQYQSARLGVSPAVRCRRCSASGFPGAGGSRSGVRPRSWPPQPMSPR